MWKPGAGRPTRLAPKGRSAGLLHAPGAGADKGGGGGGRREVRAGARAGPPLLARGFRRSRGHREVDAADLQGGAAGGAAGGPCQGGAVRGGAAGAPGAGCPTAGAWHAGRDGLGALDEDSTHTSKGTSRSERILLYMRSVSLECKISP